MSDRKRQKPMGASDFNQVKKYLERRGVFKKNATADYIRLANDMHFYAFSLFSWKFLLKNMAIHKRAFLEEIASDALQILPIALLGFRKPASILIRGILENVLRHVYFSDHPIEFERINSAQKWYLKNDELYDYIKIHPRFTGIEIKFDSINRMKSLYDDLSADIHARRLSNLELRKGLVDIKYDQQQFAGLVSFTKRASECSNFILSIYHKDVIKRIPLHFSTIITNTLPSKARRVIAGIA